MHRSAKGATAIVKNIRLMARMQRPRRADDVERLGPHDRREDVSREVVVEHLGPREGVDEREALRREGRDERDMPVQIPDGELVGDARAGRDGEQARREERGEVARVQGGRPGGGPSRAGTRATPEPPQLRGSTRVATPAPRTSRRTKREEGRERSSRSSGETAKGMSRAMAHSGPVTPGANDLQDDDRYEPQKGDR